MANPINGRHHRVLGGIIPFQKTLKVADMIFTAFRRNAARLDVFYDPLDNHFTVRNEVGEIVKNAVIAKEYLTYIIELKQAEWIQLDFNATAKIEKNRRRDGLPS